MRSHLTRRVFRQLLRNQPIVHRGCIRRASWLPWKSSKASPVANASSFPQQRTFSWSWFTGQPRRTIKAKKLDPGIEILEEQAIIIGRDERKYENKVILEAFRDFFKHKTVTVLPVLDTQIVAVLAVYKFLLKARESDPEAALSVEETLNALGRLYAGPAYDNISEERAINAFAETAQLMFEDIAARRHEQIPESKEVVKNGKDGSISTPSPLRDAGAILNYGAKKYLSTLSQRLKDGLRTKDVYMTLVQEYPELANNTELSGLVAWALAYNGDEQELETFVASLKTIDPLHSDKIWSDICWGALMAENIETIKKWYSVRPPSSPSFEEEGDRKLDNGVLGLCITTDNMAWGQPLFNELVNKHFAKSDARLHQMATILIWAMASGRDVDDLSKMMDLLAERLDVLFTTKVMNAVLGMGKLKNDPYYLERWANLMKKKRIRYNGTTYMLEMEWRLLAGDVAGARNSYTRLLGQEFKIKEAAPVINELLLALLKKDSIPHEEVMDMISEFVEMDGTFSAELVAALTKRHLQRAELHDLADLLHTHTPSFTAAERMIVRDVLVEYINEHEAQTEKWDAYAILNAIFPETPKDIRVKVMLDFFKVHRHDLAIHIFNHMRQNARKEYRPDNNTYAQFFEGMAPNRNHDALAVGHNMLKVDLDVEPDTPIRASLMLAYALCNRPYIALKIWDEIMYSREGPNFAAINAAFRACHDMPDGLKRAQEIWNHMQKQDVDIPKETTDSYIATLSAQSQWDEAKKMVSQLSEMSGGRYKGDALSILAVINPSYGEERTKAITWAKETYPEEFKAIEAGGKSPLERRYRVKAHLPEDGSYKAYWNELGVADWEEEYIDWKRMWDDMENDRI